MLEVSDVLFAWLVRNPSLLSEFFIDEFLEKSDFLIVWPRLGCFSEPGIPQDVALIVLVLGSSFKMSSNVKTCATCKIKKRKILYGMTID